ncbi:conjugal transfer protein [Vibrio sagamiensis]|uniref:Conjugal transfer protein n=1 Tax=Vibrio sagamiensis NBRC 104589 TaxID=1219064 RepID=A0A511QIS4_9VIBR|nr:conjugal transfer protein [Vibrio sagamiensis]GEM77225.1 hypothetical protein VSA01S_33370 [Vibrio sagamiensis NBRC 104589]
MDTITVENNHKSEAKRQLSREALLVSERNRYFFLLLACVGVIALLVMFCWYAFAKAEHNQEIAYVKLSPNGAWQVVEYQPQDEQLYFKTTVDALIERYTIARFKGDSSTIEADWGEASAFMSSDLKAYFLAKDGFDAWSKIDQLKKQNRNASIDIRYVEHYDKVDVHLSSGRADKALRTNVYFTRELSGAGQKTTKEALVLSLQWRLVDKTTLTNTPLSHLRVNPIGVEILKESLNKERRHEE